MASSRLAAVWAAGKWIILLAGALVLSLVGNGVLLRKAWTANAQCQTDMERAARIAIENERKRAADAEEQADAIVAEQREETANNVSDAQRNTNAREAKIQTVVVHGDCRMPDGLPRLDPAVAEANAAAR